MVGVVRLRRVVNLSPSLPGHELVVEGLADLAAGRQSAAGLLVAMASPRLRELGIEVPLFDGPQPSHRLFELLALEGPGAHSRYNALVRRIVSFARAAEQERHETDAPAR
jgi:hypothetical protein